MYFSNFSLGVPQNKLRQHQFFSKFSGVCDFVSGSVTELSVSQTQRQQHFKELKVKLSEPEAECRSRSPIYYHLKKNNQLRPSLTSPIQIPYQYCNNTRPKLKYYHDPNSVLGLTLLELTYFMSNEL